MFCPSQRRTCRRKLAVCPGPCNRRNRRRSVSPENKVEDASGLEGSSPGRKIFATPTIPSLSGSRDTLNCQESPESSMCLAKCSLRNQGETPAEKCYGFDDEGEEPCRGLATTSNTRREPKTIETTLKRITRTAPAVVTTFFVSVVHFPLILLSLFGTSYIPLAERSPWTKCLITGGIFVAGHVLVGYAAWNNPIFQTFLAAEFCGLLTLLFWRVSGSIPL